MDKDGDGKLNEEERKAAMAARPKPVKANPAESQVVPVEKKARGKRRRKEEKRWCPKLAEG